MNSEHEQELRDLLRRFRHSKRSHYDARERYLVLKRFGTVQPATFANLSDAISFAKGYISGPHGGPECAFVVDMDPEFAMAHLVSHADSASTVDLKDEIKNLYDGFTDGEKYAENLVEQRRNDRLLAAKHQADHQQGSHIVIAMIVAGVILILVLFG